MNKDEIQSIDNLTLDLYMELCILKCAVISYDKDLEISDLINFTERIYKLSSEIRNIFNDTSS